MTKLKKSNCKKKTQKLQLGQNLLTQIVAKLKILNCNQTKTQIVTKLKNSNWDENSIMTNPDL